MIKSGTGFNAAFGAGRDNERAPPIRAFAQVPDGPRKDRSTAQGRFTSC
jgi:hypothetical protein